MRWRHEKRRRQKERLRRKKNAKKKLLNQPGKRVRLPKRGSPRTKLRRKKRIEV